VKLLNTAFVMVFALSFTFAFADGDRLDQDNFSLEETRNFVSSNFESVSTAQMSIAQVPDGFDCPLFSNSPYTDILSAIDGLQTSINMFPKCEATDRSTDVMTSLSSDIRQKVIDARSMQEQGETKKLGLSAQQILSTATRLQDVITKASSSPDANCYKTEESKKLIFSINDTFQSIAPLALEFVAKNPTLTTMLAPYLPVVAGAQAVSKGLTVLEAALKYVPTLQMSNPENRTAVIKNTCSFMKVYNKVEFLTLDRASRLKKINRDFDSKIKESLKAKKSVIDSMGGMSIASNPTDAAIIKIKDNSERHQKLLGKATDELSLQNGKASEISTCSVIKTIYGMHMAESILADMVRLSELLQKTDQVAFKKTKLEEFINEMKRSDVLQTASTCSEMGSEWLEAQKESLAETKILLADYDSMVQGSNIQEIAKIKVSREDKKTANLLENKTKLNIFTDLSVFEPGELAKRMRSLPKYLFNGPDGNWYAKRKNGPVYDLLHDNELSFERAIEQFTKQVNYFKTFERKVLVSQQAKIFPQTSALQQEYFKKIQAAQLTLEHATNEYAPVGSYDHRELCNKAKLAIKFYVEATDHLISNEYLCKMIDPVLKEGAVSGVLKDYCQSSKATFSNKILMPGYKELARPLFVKNGPKRQIELIMKKYDQLNCN
jgi:hypothetical protein